MWKNFQRDRSYPGLPLMMLKEGCSAKGNHRSGKEVIPKTCSKQLIFVWVPWSMEGGRVECHDAKNVVWLLSCVGDWRIHDPLSTMILDLPKCLCRTNVVEVRRVSVTVSSRFFRTIHRMLGRRLVPGRIYGSICANKFGLS